MASKQAKRKRGSRFAPDGRVVSVSETLANIVNYPRLKSVASALVML